MQCITMQPSATSHFLYFAIICSKSSKISIPITTKKLKTAVDIFCNFASSRLVEPSHRQVFWTYRKKSKDAFKRDADTRRQNLRFDKRKPPSRRNRGFHTRQRWNFRRVIATRRYSSRKLTAKRLKAGESARRGVVSYRRFHRRRDGGEDFPSARASRRLVRTNSTRSSRVSFKSAKND